MDHGTMTSTSSSLIHGLKADDPEAWRRLAKIHGPLVYAWCRQTGLTSADVPDVAQDVFVSVYRSIAGFHRDRPEDTFRGWLWQITRNAVLAHQRRCRHLPVAAGGTNAQQAIAQTPQPADLPEPPSNVGAQSLVVRRVLNEIRGEFRPTTWQAFWRTAIDQQTATAVGAELGMTPDAVRHAKRRVLTRLREFLAPE